MRDEVARRLRQNEVVRRLVHASGTVVPLGYLLIPAVTWGHVQVLLVAGSVLTLVLEAIRLLVGLQWALFDRLTREYEQDNLAGYALYVFGATAVALAFRPTIALPAMFMLMITDPVSGLLSAGELRRAKRGPVLAVAFLLSTVLALPFVPLVPALLGGLTAAVADGIKPVVAGYVIDDNLTIPIGAAVAMYVGGAYLPAV